MTAVLDRLDHSHQVVVVLIDPDRPQRRARRSVDAAVAFASCDGTLAAGVRPRRRGGDARDRGWHPSRVKRFGLRAESEAPSKNKDLVCSPRRATCVVGAHSFISRVGGCHGDADATRRPSRCFRRVASHGGRHRTRGVWSAPRRFRGVRVASRGRVQRCAALGRVRGGVVKQKHQGIRERSSERDEGKDRRVLIKGKLVTRNSTHRSWACF